MTHLFPVAALGLAVIFAQPLQAQEYPLSIETKFGTSVIESQPQRVATVDYAGTDDILALGFQPLTARYWFGDYDNSIWPWAQPYLTDEPEVLRGNLNFEQIAATDPDVIIAIRSGITDEEYDRLSQIAPVVAVPPGMGDYELTWDQRAMVVGRALGKEDEAAARVAAIRDRLAEVAAAHPGWAGTTFAMATFWDGSVGLYSAGDSGTSLIASMGLQVPDAVKDLSVPGEYYVTLSQEMLPVLDQDVLFWYTTADNMAGIDGLELRPLMRAYKEGREVMLPDTSMSSGALSYGSLLSLPAAIDALVPQIEAAADGDPATAVVTP